MPQELHDEDSAQLAAYEREVISQLKPEEGETLPPSDEEVPATPAAPAAPAATPPATPPAAPAAPVAAATPPATPPATTEPKPQGDLKAALRASRHAERMARERAERAERELEEARKAAPAPTPQKTELDAELETLEADVPPVAKVVKHLLKEVSELKQTAAAPAAPAAPAQPEFVPETLPPQLQEIVDENDALLSMQHDPNQDRWQLAKSIDGMLTTHPVWKAKPVADRLAEVVRRVNLEVAPPVTAAAAAPAERSIESLSDLRGGVAPANNTPDYSRMSDEDILASLKP